MKGRITLLAVSMALCANTAIAADSVNTTEAEDYLSELSALISSTDNDSYIGYLNLTIGSDTMVLDGERLKIDDDGSVPIIENDTTLLPIRGVAEAIGADVDYQDTTQTVTLCNDETEVNMQLGSAEIEINGQTQQMSVAAQLVNDRTLIPLRAAAEALGCDVQWDGTDQTITLTRPYQTKRIIAHSENVNTEDASAVVVGNDMTILQFDTEEQARQCAETNNENGIYAQPDYVYTLGSLSWGTDRIKSPSYCNSKSSNQSDITVAVIDSGIDRSNSCFNGKVTGGYDFVNNDSDPNDENGHGTHVVSTVADVTAGFNKVKILPLKTSGRDGISYSTTIDAAVRYAVSAGAKVINLSMGGYHNDKTQRLAIEHAISKDVTVVAAAGNDNVNISNNFFSPACITGVVAVAALDSSNKKASYSNYGDGSIDIAAPGNSIVGAAIGGGTTTKSGTSMASPHIAGAIALIRSANPNYTSTESVNKLKESAVNIGSSSYYGAGIPDLSRLVPNVSEVTVNTLNAENISETNATVYGSVSYSGSRPSEVGLYFGTSENNLKKVAADKINHSKNPFDMWYDLNAEAGQYLSSDTTYYYQCYAVQNGAEYKGSVNSFKTAGSSESSLTITTGAADSVTAGNAILRGTASYKGARPTEVGLYLGTSPDSMTKVAKDNIDHNKNPFDIWYDLNDEVSLYLSPGTTYYYKIYGIQNGVETSGEIKSFSTSNANSYTARVVNTDGSLAINSEPKVGSKIGEIPEGDTVTVYPDRSTGNWYWVSYNGISGYSYKDYITADINSSNTRIGVVSGTDGSLAINRNPKAGTKVGEIPEGASVTIYPEKTSGNWYWVSYNGIYGYSYKDYIILN